MQTKPGASKNLFFVLGDSVKQDGKHIAFPETQRSQDVNFYVPGFGRASKRRIHGLVSFYAPSDDMCGLFGSLGHTSHLLI